MSTVIEKWEKLSIKNKQNSKEFLGKHPGKGKTQRYKPNIRSCFALRQMPM